MGARPHGQPVRPGTRGRARPGAGDRLRQRASFDPAQIRGRDALPAGPPHPLGQTVLGGGYAGEPRKADHLSAAAYTAFNSTRPQVGLAGGAAFVAVAFVVTVALPLATYTTSLALFGLAHV